MADDSTSYGSFHPFIEGADYPLRDYFSRTSDNPYIDACINRLLSEDYHTPPPAIDTPYSDFAYGELPSERPTAVTPNSAFTAYKTHSLSVPQQKQTLHKRCFDFVRRMGKISQRRSSWDDCVNARMVEESYAYTHRMSERKRRNKLNQQFMELRSLLPQNSKGDRHSVLSNAILQLNHLKLRKEELERKNKALADMYTRSMSEGYSGTSLDGGGGLSEAGASTTDVTMRRISDEAVVVFEKSNIPDEDNIQVTLERKRASNHTDAIISVMKCLRELKVEVVRMQWRNSDSDPQVNQATIGTRAKGKGWQISQKKCVEEVVKRALHLV